jgi:hypothetical protein
MRCRVKCGARGLGEGEGRGRLYGCPKTFLVCRVPPALQPFMMGMEFIPFRKMFDAKGKLVNQQQGPAENGSAAMSSS